MVSKSGHIFDRSLITAYIHEHGKDPITGEELNVDDLIEVKRSDSVRPRPPTLTSIPSLLSSLQDEWDAMALEMFSLRQQLAETKRELSTALYQNDAAVRVVARLTKERDEARESLTKLTASLGVPDAMEVDESVETKHENENVYANRAATTSVPLPSEYVDKVNQKQTQLKRSRKGRPISDEWATQEQIRQYSETHKTKQLFTSVTTGSTYQNLLLTGGGKGNGGIFSIDTHELKEFKADGIITSVGWSPDGGLFTVGTKTGSVQLFDTSTLELKWTLKLYSSPLVVCNFIPEGTLILSADKAGTYSLTDVLTESTVASASVGNTVHSGAIHPDGVLAAFSTEGQISFYDLTQSQMVALAHPPSQVSSLCFSENGYWMIAGTSSAVLLYDLRKAQGLDTPLEPVNSIPFSKLSGQITSVSFDYTGRYLVAGSEREIEVCSYDKSTKQWTPGLASFDLWAVSVSWGSLAKSIVAVTAKGNIVVFG